MKRRPAPSIQDLLSKLQIQCIGLITAEWAFLEAMVSVAIWDYCNLDREKGLSLTADLGSKAKINILGALAKQHFAGDSAAAEVMANLVADMDRLNSERNRIVHNPWSKNVFTGAMRTMRPSTSGKSLKQKILERTDAQLVKTYEEIAGLVDRLLMFQEDHGISPKSRPEKKSP